MTTTNQPNSTAFRQRRTRRRMAVATALAAGTIVAGALGQSAPAEANVDYYVALAYSYQSDVPGFANNLTDSEEARFAALRNCQDANGGNHCIWYGSFRNTCAALAVLGAKDWATGTGPDPRTAEQRALAANPGGRIVASGCAHTPPGHGGPITSPPTHTLIPTAPQ